MLRRWVAVVLAAVVTVAGWAGGAQPARADGSLWWLPTSWISAVVGTAADLRDALTGGTVPVDPGSDALSLGEPPDPPGIGYSFVIDSAQGVQSGTTWTLTLSYHCLGGNSCGSNPMNNSGWKLYVCADGTYAPTIASVSSSSASGAVLVYDTTNRACDDHGGVVGGGSTGSYSSSARLQAWLYTFGAAVKVTETEVTCRDLSTGVDTVVSETATGVSVAPQPTCPAGTVPIRVRVIQNGVVIADSSISQSAIDNYGAYLADPTAWGWYNDGGSNCHIQSNEDPTLVIALSVDVCNEANEGGVGQSPEEQDCGTDIVCSVIEAGTSTISRILTGIASGVSQIVSTVKSIVTKITDAARSIVDGVAQALGDAADRIVQAVKDLEQAVRDGIQSILDKMNEGSDGGGGDDGGGDDGGGDGTGPGDVGLGGFEPGDITGKFTPWTDSLGDLIGVFNRPDPGCRGPEVRAAFVGAGRDFVFDAYPFDACAEPMATVATVVRSGLAIMFVIFGALSCIRILGSSFGVAGIGSGGASAGGEE